MGEELMKRMRRLEFHQRLLLQMIDGNRVPFLRLIIEKNLDEEEMEHFYQLCDELNKKWQEQKEEGFLFFESLLEEFQKRLNPKLDVAETIEACRRQKVYPALMEELAKYLPEQG